MAFNDASSPWDYLKNRGISHIFEDVASLITRPPRSTYPIPALGPAIFRIQSDDGKPSQKAFQRHDFFLENMRGMKIECSWYRPYVSASTGTAAAASPSPVKKNDESSVYDDDDEAPATPKAPAETRRPVVVYCHGNSGSRLDGQEILYLLGLNVTVFTFDFTGSGVSGGDHVTLGINERIDLAVIVDHLRASPLVSELGLWGRSMGAVSSIMYAARDPTSIRFLVLDSPFSTLRFLIADLVAAHADWAPTAFIEVIVEKVRRHIIRSAMFDINDLDVLSAARRCRVPCLIIHGKSDDFVLPKHGKWISEAWGGGGSLFVECVGGHNDERMADARDVAAQLIELYLITKPQAEAAPDRRKMLLEMEEKRQSMKREEAEHLRRMKELHDQMEKEAAADREEEKKLLAEQEQQHQQHQQQQRQQISPPSAMSAAAVAAVAADIKAHDSPVLNSRDGLRQVVHVRAGESVEQAKKRDEQTFKPEDLERAIASAFHGM
jgi:pimeloyl-ACP methyl ester carboxylesterase